MSSVILHDLGAIDYMECWKLQEKFFDSLVAAKTGRGQVFAETTAVNGNTATRVAVTQTEAELCRGFVANAPAKGCKTDAGEACGFTAGMEVESHEPDAEQVLLLCEHPHVYTLGKSGQLSNMLIDPNMLERIGATFYKVDRGGDITYHGPGQLVGYPILDLESMGLGLKEYVHRLEQTIIGTLAHFGIEAGRSEGATGVWLSAGNGKPLRKIAAIGVRSSHYVTMHGFALNVDPALEYFSHINPCGFIDRGVTSMSKETGTKMAMDEVKAVYRAQFEKEFGSVVGK